MSTRAGGIRRFSTYVMPADVTNTMATNSERSQGNGTPTRSQ